MAGVFTRDDFTSLRMNLHKVLAYMDSYRKSLVNLQESSCYYIGVVINNTSTVWTANGTEVTVTPENAWLYDYGYKAIDLQSLDNFFMFLRIYTGNPNFNSKGEVLNLDLSDFYNLKAFITDCATYLCNSIGIGSPDADPSRTYVCCSALRYFLEVTGLIPVDIVDDQNFLSILDAICSGE